MPFESNLKDIEEKNRNSRLYVERFGSLGLIFMAIIGCFVLIILLFQIFSASQAEHWETEVEGTKPWSYDLGANSTTSQRWEFPTSDVTYQISYETGETDCSNFFSSILETIKVKDCKREVKTFSGSVTVVDNGPVDQVITLTESGLSSSSIEIATMEYLIVQNDLDLPVVISQTSGELPFQSVKPNTQQKWNNPTYSLQSDYESIQSGSNITYTIYWLPEEKDCNSLRALFHFIFPCDYEHQFEGTISVVDDGPEESMIIIDEEGIKSNSQQITHIEVTKDTWLKFQHEMVHTVYIEQTAGPVPNANEEGWPLTGDFVVTVDTELNSDSIGDGTMFAFLLLIISIILLSHSGIRYTLPKLSQITGDINSPSNQATASNISTSLAITFQSPRHSFSEGLAWRNGEFSLTNLEVKERAFSSGIFILGLVISFFFLSKYIDSGLDERKYFAAIICTYISFRCFDKLSTAAERLRRLNISSVNEDRFFRMVEGRDGILLAAQMALIFSIFFIPLRFSIPFIFDNYSDVLEPYNAGLRAAYWGTIYVVLYSLFFAVPLSIGAAIWLEEYAGKNKITEFIQALIANLAGVPSVVFGLFGLAIFVQEAGLGWNLGRTILAAGLTMATMAMPSIVLAGQESLRSVPNPLREGAFAVGCTKWEVVRDHLVPYALPGMMTGTILSFSRVIGEAAPLIVVGGVTFITFEPNVCYWTELELGGDQVCKGEGFLESNKDEGKFTVMPVQVYNWMGEARTGYETVAAAGAAVLLVLLLVVNSIAILLRQHYRKQLK